MLSVLNCIFQLTTIFIYVWGDEVIEDLKYDNEYLTVSALQLSNINDIKENSDKSIVISLDNEKIEDYSKVETKNSNIRKKRMFSPGRHPFGRSRFIRRDVSDVEFRSTQKESGDQSVPFQKIDQYSYKIDQGKKDGTDFKKISLSDVNTLYSSNRIRSKGRESTSSKAKSKQVLHRNVKDKLKAAWNESTLSVKGKKNSHSKIGLGALNGKEDLSGLIGTRPNSKTFNPFGGIFLFPFNTGYAEFGNYGSSLFNVNQGKDTTISKPINKIECINTSKSLCSDRRCSIECSDGSKVELDCSGNDSNVIMKVVVTDIGSSYEIFCES